MSMLPPEGGREWVGHAWATLRRRRALVVAALGAGIVLGFVVSMLTRPMYRATTTLRIERYSPDVLTFQDLSRADYSWTAYEDFYQTQYQILSSETIARRVAARLDLADRPQFDAPPAGFRPLAFVRSLIPRRSTPEVERSPEEIAADRIRSRLEVRPVQRSQLVTVSWTSEDPELAAEIANEVAGEYIRFNLSSMRSTGDEASGFLEEQIAQLRADYVAIENRVQAYGENKRIVSIDEANNVTLQALKDLAQRRTDARARLARQEAAYRTVSDLPDDALPEVRESELIGDLHAEYSRLEAEITELSRNFRDDWPALRSRRSKLEQIGLQLNNEIERTARRARSEREAAYRESLAEVANLERLCEEQESLAQRLRKDAVEYYTLSAEAAKKKEMLDALIARQSELSISSKLSETETANSNVHVLAPARVPLAPYRPNTAVNTFAGGFAGLFLGIAFAFLLEYLDNTVGSAATLEALADGPTLAEVPRHVGTESRFAIAKTRSRDPAGPGRTVPVELVAHLEPLAPVTEAYRDLRTAILLSAAGEPPRRLMVTSSVPAEGKTTVAVNLAVVLAQLGRRVLLVDADLRRPRIHDVFAVANSVGVTSLVAGMTREPRGAIVATDVPGLDLLTSGPAAPNPAELLNSERFARLLSEIAGFGYDHVVIDSPPVLAVSDAVILASLVDRFVMVVRADRTAREAVVSARDRLRQTHLAPIGFVLNDVAADARGSRSYRNAYYRRAATDAGAPPTVPDAKSAAGE